MWKEVEVKVKLSVTEYASQYGNTPAPELRPRRASALIFDAPSAPAALCEEMRPFDGNAPFGSAQAVQRPITSVPPLAGPIGARGLGSIPRSLEALAFETKLRLAFLNCKSANALTLSCEKRFFSGGAPCRK
jgi:hypothetical protein